MNSWEGVNVDLGRILLGLDENKKNQQSDMLSPHIRLLISTWGPLKLLCMPTCQYCMIAYGDNTITYLRRQSVDTKLAQAAWIVRE